jgi:hypothetical protein
MLKIFFPAGLDMQTTDTHVEYQAAYDLLKDKKISVEEKQSILLISRIFSLLNIETEAIDK